MTYHYRGTALCYDHFHEMIKALRDDDPVYRSDNNGRCKSCAKHVCENCNDVGHSESDCLFDVPDDAMHPPGGY